MWLTINAPAIRTITSRTWEIVAKLADEYQPNREVALYANCYQDINSALAAFVNKDGEVKVYNPTTSTVSYWRLGGFWMTD